jgi:hypothetical protein
MGALSVYGIYATDSEHSSIQFSVLSFLGLPPLHALRVIGHTVAIENLLDVPHPRAIILSCGHGTCSGQQRWGVPLRRLRGDYRRELSYPRECNMLTSP